MTRRVDISWKTVLFITAFLLLLWITYLILDIILLLFVAFIFVSALSPLVDKLGSFKVPRPLAILLVFLVVFGTLIGILTVSFTPLIAQTSNLSQRLTQAVAELTQTHLINRGVLEGELSNFSRQAVGYTLIAFQNFISLVSVIVITFYLLLDQKRIEKRASSLFVHSEEKVQRLISVIEDKLGAWLRGQVVLSLIVGTMVYAGLLLLNVEYALPLAIIAGLLEVIPVIGPIVSAIPAVLVALTASPLLAGLVAGLYLAVQQVEAHVIVPQVMKRAVGLNPLLVIIAVAVGSRLLGVAGALLAVPIAVVIQVVIKEVLELTES